MAEIDKVLDEYTDPARGLVSGASLIVTDKTGSIIYQKASGSRTTPPLPTQPLQLESLCFIASQTKLLTAICVLQVVEQGLITLDTDLRDVLPALRVLQILTGFSDSTSPSDPANLNANDANLTKPAPNPATSSSKPVLDSLNTPLTLRHLLLHISGFTYDIGSPALQRYSKAISRTAHTWSGTIDGYTHPLIFAPGESLSYGPGVDWAGKVVEHLTGQRLGEYMQQHIFDPLGMKNSTFHPETRSDLPTLMEMAIRPSANGKKAFTQSREKLQAGKGPWPYPAKEDMGGIGLYSTAADYIQVLSSLLTGSKPARLLSDKSIDELFRPQLPPKPKAVMNRLFNRLEMGAGIWSRDMPCDYCLAGSVNLMDVKGRRRRRTVNWGGVPNLHWWVDREAGLAGTLFTQILPSADVVVTELLTKVEEKVYDLVAEKKQAAKL